MDGFNAKSGCELLFASLRLFLCCSKGTTNTQVKNVSLDTKKKPDLLQSGYRSESEVQETQNVLTKFASLDTVDDVVGARQSLRSSCRAGDRPLASTDATDEKSLRSQACQLHHDQGHVH